jgi:hypothetical protein
MIEYIQSHPLYIPFLVFNALVIYEIYKTMAGKNKGKDDDDDNNDGGILVGNDDPILDLPPGVTLPVSPKEPVLSE